MTENLAIRTLELLADLYAKTHSGGKASVYHVKEVPTEQWSLAAIRAGKRKRNAPPGSYLRVEHGTPRRDFARRVLALYKKRRLTEQTMRSLVRRYWKLAVITHEEDRRLKRRDKFASPTRRWAAAGIRFRKSSPLNRQ